MPITLTYDEMPQSIKDTIEANVHQDRVDFFWWVVSQFLPNEIVTAELKDRVSKLSRDEIFALSIAARDAKSLDAAFESAGIDMLVVSSQS